MLLAVSLREDHSDHYVFNNNVMMVMVTVCGVQRLDEGAGRDS